MDNLLADRTVKDYVCAHCYGQLVEQADKENGGYIVACPNCGDSAGFVTRRYAERRRVESRTEKIEVDRLLDTLGIVPKPKKTPDQLLKELGY